jgi:peptide deformylase
MPIQPVIRMGTERLSQPSLPVEHFGTEELYRLIQDMKDTLQEKKGVGIAAPQIGDYRRVIMFGFDKSERYPNEKPVPFTILINPVVEILTDETQDVWEGCISVPGLRGLVPRFTKIKYAGVDPEGNPVSVIAENFHARMVQHECDHLDGILFPQRIKDLKYFGFEDEIWERVYSIKK